MAAKKISELTAASALALVDEIAVQRDGETTATRASLAQVAGLITPPLVVNLPAAAWSANPGDDPEWGSVLSAGGCLNEGWLLDDTLEEMLHAPNAFYVNSDVDLSGTITGYIIHRQTNTTGDYKVAYTLGYRKLGDGDSNDAGSVDIEIGDFDLPSLGASFPMSVDTFVIPIGDGAGEMDLELGDFFDLSLVKTDPEDSAFVNDLLFAGMVLFVPRA
ncbi:hypothetical protein [Stratiformator vulcanicus]|uniref:Uncharacterized protein n=1 Tax=Stratiformator vulcanicus TaxID=2527980 RepID=A0A517R7E6_9PLAN|nr:hypothetical protein [Stratiformator vulcanicus]QDT39741.1 hypothetical protein Pan189_41500 [Stratiformator vulcanicus]